MNIKNIGKLTCLALLGLSSFAAQAESRTICVFDPVGASGDVFAIMKDFQVKQDWGVDLDLRAIPDESIIVAELKTGACDGAVLTGIRTREFNKFAATVEAVGATLDDKGMRSVLETVLSMPKPKAEKYLRTGPYEVAGILPAGSIYAFTRDRSMYNIDGLQGKKIAVIDGDEVSQTIIKQIGGSPVMATTTSFAGKFNNGSVDLVFSPAVAYEPLELYRGLGENGGVSDYSFLQLTFQLVVRWDRFPADFGTKGRKNSLDSFDNAFKFIEKATATIDKKYWLEIPKVDKVAYDQLLRKSRITLRDNGVYDGNMLKIMRILRCKAAPTRAECAEKLE